jgi:hypothetical protein
MWEWTPKSVPYAESDEVIGGKSKNLAVQSAASEDGSPDAARNLSGP